MSSRLVLLAAGCLALAGCNTVNKNIATDDPAMGEAVKYDMAIQVVNPDPVYPEDGAQPGDSGAKAAAATKRYRSDQVNERHRRDARQSATISTTSGVSGGPQ